MIMANSSSTSSSLLTGEIKKEIISSMSSQSSTTSSSSISQTASSTSATAISNTNSTTSSQNNTTGDAKPEPQQTATKTVSSGSAPIIVNSDTRWIFPLEKIEQSPSRLDGVSKENELSERQEAALFINDLGTKLKVNQLCINTAIIYMHRFYMIHSLKKFHHYVRIVATSCLFFACKVEEQPRRLREFIDIVQSLFHKSNEPINHNSEEYKHYGDQIMALESSLIQTLGFNVLINHAHTVIIKTCQMIKAPRDLAEAAYLTATNSLILTDFCVKFSSERVACFCIYLACKWTGLIIPMSSEGLQWYEYVNHDIKEQELEDISKEYLDIYGKCSNKIKRKLGITKNQDEINSQLQPKNGQQQVRKPNSSQQYPNRPSNPSQNPNKQYANPQHPNKSHPQQQNGFHPNQQQQYQQQKQQHYQQQQRLGGNPTPNKQHQQQPGGAAGPTSSHSSNNHYNSNKNLVQPSPKNSNQNPNSGNFNNRPNFPNGTPSGSSSHPSHPSHNLNNQTGASSSMNTKSFNNLNSANGEGAINFNNNNKNMNHSNNNNGQQNSNNYQVNKKPNQTKQEQTNHKQMNGTNNNNGNNNTSLNISNSRSSPSAQLNTSSMKRGNEEIGSSNVSTAPNKIPKYVIDQKSAS